MHWRAAANFKYPYDYRCNMWQSQIEIEYYFISSSLTHCSAEIPLMVRLIHAWYTVAVNTHCAMQHIHLVMTRGVCYIHVLLDGGEEPGYIHVL